MIDSSENFEPDAEPLIEGYRAMASDKVSEEEALVWCEALIGDSAEPEDSESLR